MRCFHTVPVIIVLDFCIFLLFFFSFSFYFAASQSYFMNSKWARAHRISLLKQLKCDHWHCIPAFWKLWRWPVTCYYELLTICYKSRPSFGKTKYNADGNVDSHKVMQQANFINIIIWINMNHNRSTALGRPLKIAGVLKPVSRSNNPRPRSCCGS